MTDTTSTNLAAGCENAELLKTDRRGRVRTPKERRLALLEEFDRSGTSAAQFAQWAGINYQTFATWLQKRRKKQAPVDTAVQSPAKPVRFVEAALMDCSPGATPGGTDSLLLHAGNGIRIEVRTPAQALLAAQVLRALQFGGHQPC